MMFEAIMFLAGAVLFFLSALFFVYLWQDRTSLLKRRQALQIEVADLKEQRVELDIREHELMVWSQGLEHQQEALEQAEEELRMLTATKQLPASAFAGEISADDESPSEHRSSSPGEVHSILKNAKQDAKIGR